MTEGTLRIPSKWSHYPLSFARLRHHRRHCRKSAAIGREPSLNALAAESCSLRQSDTGKSGCSRVLLAEVMQCLAQYPLLLRKAEEIARLDQPSLVGFDFKIFEQLVESH